MQLDFHQVDAFSKHAFRGNPAMVYRLDAWLGDELMQQIAPAGPIYQAGTLSGNPVAMAAGLAMLELIQQPGFHADLAERTARLCAGLEAAAADAGVAVTTTHVGAMFGLFFTSEKVETYAQATACDIPAFNRFFHAMLDAGHYFAPSAFEAGFVSAAHSDADIAGTIAAADACLAGFTK